MLKLESVSKVYKVGTFGGKELRAVNNVSFDIKDCEVVSLIGESGSGKTTFISQLSHPVSKISSRPVRILQPSVSALRRRQRQKALSTTNYVS